MGQWFSHVCSCHWLCGRGYCISIPENHRWPMYQQMIYFYIPRACLIVRFKDVIWMHNTENAALLNMLWNLLFLNFFPFGQCSPSPLPSKISKCICRDWTSMYRPTGWDQSRTHALEARKRTLGGWIIIIRQWGQEQWRIENVSSWLIKGGSACESKSMVKVCELSKTSANLCVCVCMCMRVCVYVCTLSVFPTEVHYLCF